MPTLPLPLRLIRTGAGRTDRRSSGNFIPATRFSGVVAPPMGVEEYMLEDCVCSRYKEHLIAEITVSYALYPQSDSQVDEVNSVLVVQPYS